MRMDLSVRNVQGTIANFRAFDTDLQAEARDIVFETGQFTKELTQFFCPVDSGFMHDHVEVDYGEQGYSFEVGWRESDFLDAGLAFYPIFVVFGTQFMAAQDPLFPAHAEAKPRFIADLIDAMRRSAQRSGLS